MNRPSSRRRQTGRAAILAALLVVTGCGPGRDGGRLHDGARSLLPHESTVVAEDEGDCVELAPSPSCVHLYFFADLRLRQRIASVEAAARSAGWERTREDILAGGAELRFQRGRLRAIVNLRADALRPRNCRDRDCADIIMVERS